MNVSHHLSARLTQWRREALELSERYSDDRMAKLTLTHVEEIEKDLAAEADEPLNLVQAEAVSGYTRDYLGKLVRSGKLANVGRTNAPLIRRGDLPRKSRGEALQDCSTSHTVPVTRTQIARAVIHRQTLETS